MLLRASIVPLRALPSAILAAALVSVVYLYRSPHNFVRQHIPALSQWPDSTPAVGPALVLPPLPSEYRSDDDSESAFCTDRYSTKYLTDLRNSSFQYCNVSSYSSLTCFHSHTSNDDERDSLCISQGAVLDLTSRKFVLNCDIQEPDANDTARNVIPFEKVRSYWYETGPRYIIDTFFNFIAQSEVEPLIAGLPKKSPDPYDDERPRRFTLLVKREGEGNPWHSLLEIWSMYMTMDVLRITPDPADPEGRPFFRVPEDVDNLQVVILDDRQNGPYYDLWKLFSGREPIRLDQISGNPEAVAYFNGTDQRLIVPLAGASNPTWQNDWIPRDCTRSDMLRAFVRRVLRHYGIKAKKPAAESEPRSNDIVRVTFIDRKDANTRKLVNQDSLLAALTEAYPDNSVQVTAVDFGSLSFREQLQVVQQTDVLVGVHGAGLTHTMFLREHTTAVVEIQPSDMESTFMGFRNMANMRGISYFRTYAKPVNETADADATEATKSEGSEERAEATTPDGEARSEPSEGVGALDASDGEPSSQHLSRRATWHTENFVMDRAVFVRAVGAGIQAVYNKNLHHHEVR